MSVNDFGYYFRSFSEAGNNINNIIEKLSTDTILLSIYKIQKIAALGISQVVNQMIININLSDRSIEYLKNSITFNFFYFNKPFWELSDSTNAILKLLNGYNGDSTRVEDVYQRLKELNLSEDQLKESLLILIEKNGNFLKFMPLEFITREICMEAVLKNGDAIEHVPKSLINEDMLQNAVYSEPHKFFGSLKDI